MPYNWLRKTCACRHRAMRAGRHRSDDKDCQMNDDISDGRDRRRPSRFRRADVLAAAAGIALLAAACGGSSSPNAPMSLQQQLQQALAYSQCMRSHGIANFPDPTENSNGAAKSNNGPTYVGVQIGIPDGIDPNSPTYVSANNTCTKQTGFGHVSAATLRQALTTLLKYSECMRSHGIANFPDPIETSTGVSLKTADIDQNTSQYQAAAQACRALQPGGG
jgi:hypothetical protein